MGKIKAIFIKKQAFYIRLIIALIISLLSVVFINPFLGVFILVIFVKLNFKHFSGRNKYILKRIGLMMFTLSVIVTITFFLVFLTPGNIIPNSEKMPPETLANLEAFYGFDRPIYIQYLDYLRGVIVEGDFGVSMYDRTPVLPKIKKAAPISFAMGIIAVALGTTIGVSLGLIAALRKNTWVDYTTTFLAVIGISIPSFVLATVNQQIFSINLGWLPATYNANPSVIALVLPIISLSIFVIASMARFTRTEMLETLNNNYVTLALAKGVKHRDVVFKHAFRNALVPIITVLGPLVIAIITGSLVVETIFAIPGLGKILTTAVLSKDVFLIIATTTYLSILFLSTFLLIDILYTFIDPRINLEEARDE